MTKPLKFHVDTEAIASQFQGLKEEVESALNDGVRYLAASTNAFAHECAAKQLKTTSKKFRDALSFEEVAPNVHVVTLNEKMLWREDGFSEKSMVDDLLKKNYKVNKKGEKFKIIPFEHDGGPTQNTPKQMAILDILKTFLKTNGINYKKLETDDSGKPKEGKLHTLHIPSPKPSKAASHPALHGLNIYQYKDERGKMQRHLVTFRVVKESHKGDGRWVHPGIKGVHILDQALEFAMSTWEREVLPEILNRFRDF